MKPTLKPYGCKRLKPEHEKLLSNFAFNFRLRRYILCLNRDVRRVFTKQSDGLVKVGRCRFTL
jgi:hypothetical protein